MIPQSIVDKVKEDCKCVLSTDSDDAINRLIAKALRAISVLTCWGDGECSTLLKGDRREEIDIDLDYCDCFGSVYKSAPFYNKNVTVTSVKLIRITDTIAETTLSIVDSYNETLGVFFINLNQQFTFSDGSTENPAIQCGCCKAEYKLIIEYEAGYDDIPDCIMDILCRIIGFIKLSASGCETAQDACYIEDKVAFGTYVIEKSNALETIKFSAPDDKILKATVQMMQYYQVLELKAISICKKSSIWGSVV